MPRRRSPFQGFTSSRHQKSAGPMTIYSSSDDRTRTVGVQEPGQRRGRTARSAVNRLRAQGPTLEFWEDSHRGGRTLVKAKLRDPSSPSYAEAIADPERYADELARMDEAWRTAGRAILAR